MASQQNNVPQLTGQEPATSTVADNTSNDEWDEARLEEGLRTLKEMHIQLRNLRTGIPRVVDPLASIKSKPPVVVLNEYKSAVQKIGTEMQTFKEFAMNEETKKVMEYAEKSREKNGVPSKPWIASDQPGWSVRDS